ncbi:ribonuclease E/G [Novosphingobium sp. Chol11]|uniref:Rne/Rng family ribonuclease n=1 Tax=Novosphingobium sp. Chol11 TaxID=1385763 RepID=UPI0025EDF058|nr:ribonuclease E/G [Novosphingobium sp. Chol11]
MTTRMLIDARHQEETRVAVLKGNRIEEFDFESADHKQIKGNIYLAKVTRVEPSLQAAFVDFGGNRHGFLAFSEIHPDYYQIPKEDREALLAEEAAHAEEEAALRAADEASDDDLDGDDGYDNDFDDGEGFTEVDTSEKDHVATIEGGVVENGFDGDDDAGDDHEDGRSDDDARGDEDDSTGDDGDSDGDGDSEGDGNSGQQNRRKRGRRQGRGQAKEADDLRAKRMALRRRYKIQDVIQRRQVLLVQVVKEERGNKGAALTSYLSLAGRYCVLMPNSSHGGGISRKINSAADRKRLKTIMGELDLPRSMSCIVRTAGLQRTKPEIKRDFDYLARLWDEIRERTLGSTAPALIHSDSDLIKRAIRDIYNREIEEVVVEGEQGCRAARDFMKLLMPSHVKRVRPYADPVPLFQRYGAEDQLTAMYDPVVQLRSGGYLVINPTEALVSIDINSGRSTKEHGIEATALNTNLEAAREIARQLRLRDMAGLVVIDFIDMEYGSNVRKVEKLMKDALRDDRARIQVGRISGFGLMEMSRQRLRTGVLEATTRGCPHCDGSGLVRTASSAGLSALRLIEDEAAKGKGNVITLFASQEAAIYVLNAKRADLTEIEMRYGVSVEVVPEGENEGAKMRVASRGPKPDFVPRFEPILEPEEDDLDDEYGADDEDEAEDREEAAGERSSNREGGDGAGDGARRKRRKRRRSRGRERGDEDGERVAESGEAAEGDEAEAGEAEDRQGDPEDSAAEQADGERGPRKRRRRGRRRRGSRENGDAPGENGTEEGAEDAAEDGDYAGDDVGETETREDLGGETADEVADPAPVMAETAAQAPADEAPAKPKRSRRKVAADPVAEPIAEDAAAEAAPEAKPKRVRRKKVDTVTDESPAAEAPIEEAGPIVDAGQPVAAEPAAEEAAAKPKRVRRKKADDAPVEVVAKGAPGEMVATMAEPEPASEPEPAASAETAEQPTGEPRRGWWQRTFGA